MELRISGATKPKAPSKDTWLILSGPMTGIRNYNYETFNLTAQLLRSEGYEVVNPADTTNDPHPQWTWGQYMGRCLDVIKTIHDEGRPAALVVLQGWRESAGAQIERTMAEFYDWPIYRPVDILRSLESAPIERERAII